MASGISVPLRVLFFVGGILIAPLPSGGLQQTSSQNETIGRVPHAIAVGDFNGDGIPTSVSRPPPSAKLRFS